MWTTTRMTTTTVGLSRGVRPGLHTPVMLLNSVIDLLGSACVAQNQVKRLVRARPIFYAAALLHHVDATSFACATTSIRWPAQVRRISAVTIGTIWWLRTPPIKVLPTHMAPTGRMMDPTHHACSTAFDELIKIGHFWCRFYFLVSLYLSILSLKEAYLESTRNACDSVL